MPNFMRIYLVAAELFHAEERTDRQTARTDEANSRFSQFFDLAYKGNFSNRI